MSSSAEQPQTILLVPTGAGAGLTSACLGLIQALDTIGLKAGFLKPFMQDELNGPGLDRSTALVSRTLNVRPPAPIPQAHLERLLRDDHIDDLMEEVIERLEQVTQQAQRDALPLDLVVVEGVVPTPHTTYATQANAQLAHALNARIILVGTGDLNAPQELAEELDTAEWHIPAAAAAEETVSEVASHSAAVHSQTSQSAPPTCSSAHWRLSSRGFW